MWWSQTLHLVKRITICKIAVEFLFNYWYAPNSILSKIGNTKVSDTLAFGYCLGLLHF